MIFMEKLYDIIGSFSTMIDETTDNENPWLGRVIIDDKNFFEGVIENACYSQLYFTFGKIDNGKILLFTGDNELDSVPKQYSAIKNKSSYYGIYSAKDAYTEVPMGECFINLTSADMTREVTDYELTIVKRKTEEEKKKINETTRTLYDNFVSSYKNKQKVNKSLKTG